MTSSSRAAGLHRRGHAVRREDHGRPVRNLVQRGDEHRSLRGQPGDRLRVGGQLTVDVHGAAVGHGAPRPGQRLGRAAAPRAARRHQPAGPEHGRPLVHRRSGRRHGDPVRRAGRGRDRGGAAVPLRARRDEDGRAPTVARVSAVRNRRVTDPRPLAQQAAAHQRGRRARQRTAHRIPYLRGYQHLARGHAGAGRDEFARRRSVHRPSIPVASRAPACGSRPRCRLCEVPFTQHRDADGRLIPRPVSRRAQGNLKLRFQKRISAQ